MIFINGLFKKCIAFACSCVCAVSAVVASVPTFSAKALNTIFVPENETDFSMLDGVFPSFKDLAYNWDAFVDRTFNFDNSVAEGFLNGGLPVGSAIRDLFTNWTTTATPLGSEYKNNYVSGDTSTVDYATYDNSGNILSLTVPNSYDITGKVCYRYPDNTFDLVQCHLYLNGYRCMTTTDTVVTAHYDDCLMQITLLQDNGQSYQRTYYLKPRDYTCFYDQFNNAIYFEHRFCYDLDNFSEWHFGRLQFRVRSTNNCDIQRPLNAKVRDMTNSGNFNNAIFPELFLTGFTSSDPQGVEYVSKLKSFSGANSATIPVQTFGITGGTVVDVNNPSTGFYNYNGGLAFDVTTLTSLTRQLENTLYSNFRELYTHIPKVYEPWTSDNTVDYYQTYNYYPPVTGVTGVPSEWLVTYPTITTAFYVEPYEEDFPAVTVPPVPASAFPLSDILNRSGLVPVAVALGVLSLAAGLIL